MRDSGEGGGRGTDLGKMGADGGVYNHGLALGELAMAMSSDTGVPGNRIERCQSVTAGRVYGQRREGHKVPQTRSAALRTSAAANSIP